MEQRKLISENQKVTEQDFLDFGLFPQKTFDDIGSGLLIPDAAFWGFSVVAEGGTNVAVGEGWLISNGRVYYNQDEGGTTFDMLPRLPVATRRYITLGTWGQEIDAEAEPRTFLIDATTRATEARVVATERIRRAELSVVSGVEGPDPVPPALPNNVLGVADILLDTTGIVSITMREDNRAPNLRTLLTMSRAFEAWRIRIQALIDTLASDLAALAARIKGLAPRALIVAVAQDLAQVKDRVGIPDDYVAWASDHFLDYDESDIDYPDWLSLVEEGARFPYAQQRDAQLGLLNPLDPNVMIASNFVLPAYDPVERIAVTGNDGEVSISSIQYQTVNYKLMSRARCRIRYGEAFKQCTNSAWWQAGRYDPLTGIFKRGAEVFEVMPEDRHTATINHKWIRLRQFWQDCWDEYYLDRLVTSTSVSGSVLAETFLNSQEGWLIAINLYFTRKAASGDVKILICEANDAGAPQLSRSICEATLAPVDIRIYPTKTRVQLFPTALKAGKRYAIVLITGGNHYLAYVSNNKFTSGSLFTSTDTAWFQGDLLKDIAFGLEFCRFRSPRVEVQMQPLQLENGIGAVDINADMILPPGEGFQIIHQVQLAGIWRNMQAEDVTALIGLPAMLPYRVVFLGTTEMMPGLGVGSNSRVLTWRARADMTHVSEIRDMPGTTEVNTVIVKVRLEQWRGSSHHTCVIKLLINAPDYNTVVTADTTQDESAEDDPFTAGSTGAIYRTATFTFSAGNEIPDYRVRISGTTDSVVACFHVAERIDIGMMV